MIEIAPLTPPKLRETKYNIAHFAGARILFALGGASNRLPCGGAVLRGRGGYWDGENNRLDSSDCASRSSTEMTGCAGENL